MTARVTIGKGWGYWDTTHFPYGGAFRRSDGTVEVVEIIGPAGHFPNRERRVRLGDGREAVVELGALVFLEERAQ